MKLLIAALLAVFSTGTMAEWTQTQSNNSGVSYIDKATVHRLGNIVKMWAMADFKSPQNVGDGRPYLSSQAFIGYDCVEGRTAILEFTNFSGNMGRGASISRKANAVQWRNVPPEQKRIYESLCVHFNSL